MPDHLERDQGGAELPEDNPALRALSRLLLHLADRVTDAELAAGPRRRRPGPPLPGRLVGPEPGSTSLSEGTEPTGTESLS